MSTQYAVDLKFSAKTRELDAAVSKLNSFDRTASKLKGKNPFEAAERGARGAGRAAATATGNIQRFGIAFRSTVAPIVAAYGALNFFNRSLKTMGDREADAAVLANGLRKVGAGAGQLEKLQKVASKLGEQTLFNQEDFTQGFALLTSFRAIGVASYGRVAKAAADVATVTKTDVNSSLLQLSKALENPVEGMSALSRSGTTFTTSQKAMVKSLVESGRQLEAQEYLLRIVEGQYKGASSEAAKGFAGQIDTLNENFRDFQEVVGKGVLPVVSELAQGLTGVFKALAQVDPKLITAATKAAVFAAKLLLVNKAIKAMIGLRAGVASMLLGTASNVTAAGNASAIAAGKVRALAASLRTLAAIGIVTVGVDYLINGARTGASIEDLNKRLEAGGTGASLRSGGSAVTREAVVEAQKTARETIKAAQAELDKMKPPGWLSALPIIGPATIGAQGGRIQQLRGRIADAKTVLGLDPNKFKPEAQQVKTDLDLTTEDDKDGTGGGTDAAERQRALADLQGQVALKKELATLDRQIFDELQKKNFATAAALEMEKILLERQERIAEIMRSDADAATKELEIKQATLEADQKLVQASQGRQKAQADFQQSVDDMLNNIQRQIELEGAGSQELRRQLEIQYQIEDINKGELKLTQDQVQALKDKNLELDKTKEKANAIK